MSSKAQLMDSCVILSSNIYQTRQTLPKNTIGVLHKQLMWTIDDLQWFRPDGADRDVLIAPTLSYGAQCRIFESKFGVILFHDYKPVVFDRTLPCWQECQTLEGDTDGICVRYEEFYQDGSNREDRRGYFYCIFDSAPMLIVRLRERDLLLPEDYAERSQAQ